MPPPRWGLPALHIRFKGIQRGRTNIRTNLKYKHDHKLGLNTVGRGTLRKYLWGNSDKHRAYDRAGGTVGPVGLLYFLKPRLLFGFGSIWCDFVCWWCTLVYGI